MTWMPIKGTVMFQDTTDRQTNFYCECMSTRTYTHGICDCCGGVEPKPDDIVAEMRVFEEDHEPDGWPAVKMRQISALCDEIERLREEAARLRRGLEAAKSVFVGNGEDGYAKACDTFLIPNVEFRGSSPLAGDPLDAVVSPQS